MDGLMGGGGGGGGVIGSNGPVSLLPFIGGGGGASGRELRPMNNKSGGGGGHPSAQKGMLSRTTKNIAVGGLGVATGQSNSSRNGSAESTLGCAKPHQLMGLMYNP